MRESKGDSYSVLRGGVRGQKRRCLSRLSLTRYCSTFKIYSGSLHLFTPPPLQSLPYCNAFRVNPGQAGDGIGARYSGSASNTREAGGVYRRVGQAGDTHGEDQREILGVSTR